MEEITIPQLQHLNRIFARLFSVRPQSIAIIGDWQNGKSTLLKQIIDPRIHASFKPETLQPFFFLYDIGSGFQDWEHLLQTMVTHLADASGSEIPPGNHYHTFQELVKRLQDRYCIYVLFDNFELLTQNPQVPLEFYSYLRSLANSYRIAYVTTSRASLQSQCVSQDICESPFFNIFTNIELKGFTASDTAALIQACGSSADPVQSFALCGGHPGLTRRWLEHVQFQGPSREEFIAANTDYTVEWINHFDADTTTVLRAAAQGTPVPQPLKYLHETLIRKGYLNAAGQIAPEVFRVQLQSTAKPEKKAGLFKHLFRK